MKNLRLSLRTKLLSGFGAVLLVTALVGGVAISQMGSIAAGTKELQRTTVPGVSVIGEVSGEIALYRLRQLEHVTAGAASERQDLARELEAQVPHLREDFARYAGEFAEGSGDLDRTQAVQRDFDAYVDATAPALVASSEGREAEAARLLDDADALYAELQQYVGVWRDAKVELGEATYDAAEATADRARLLTIALLVAALLIGAGVAVVVSRQIRDGVTTILGRIRTIRDHDVAELSAGLDALAHGDLTYEVAATTEPIETWPNDELGNLSRATNSIVEKLASSVDSYNVSRASLSTMIGEVAETAAGVSSASQQVAHTSDEAGRAVQEIASALGEVAQGAQRQVESVGSAREVAEQVNSVTSESAVSAQTTAEAADRARTVASEGQAAVTQATAAMTAVRDASQEASDVIRQLGAKSNQISGIVATITGIAEQTNLLALNAAIEAARAGEQGRGFAVVADEVRKLAEESQRAAAGIGELVGQIQAETGRAIEVVESSAGRTQEGVETVEQARRSFELIGTSVDDVTGRVGDIAAAVQQIAASAQRMRSDMDEVSSVAEQTSASSEQVSASTQETSASTQEIAASAQQLARGAEHLEGLVAQFKR